MNSISRRIRLLSVLLGSTVAVLVLQGLLFDHAFTSTAAQHVFPECSDGIDNDADGDVDYPQDHGCETLFDNSEGEHKGIYITLSDGKDRAEPGQHLVYSVRLSNEYPGMELTDVRFFVPAQLTNISVSNGGHREGNSIFWKNVAVEHGHDRMLTVHATVDPHAHEGEVIATEVFNSSGESAGDITHVVYHEAPNGIGALDLSVTDGKAYVLPDEVVKYVVTVANPEAFVQTVDLHTTLPRELTIHEISGRHNRDGRKISWKKLRLEPGQVREFFIHAHVDREAADYFQLRVKVSAGKYTVTDTTSVGARGLVENTLNLGIYDGRQSVKPGELITYEVVLENPSPVLMTDMDVQAKVPQFTEFVDTNEGGQYAGSMVRWEDLTVSPFSKRVLPYTVRVRSDAILGHSLEASVIAGGNKAVDVTDVSFATAVHDVPPPPPVRDDRLIRRRVSNREVQPGGLLDYTVRFRNTTNQPLHDLRVEERFDPQYMHIGDPRSAIVGQDRLTWSINALQPGEEWSARYTAQVLPHAPHGQGIATVTAINGKGLQAVPLPQRVYRDEVRVLHHLPPTGAGLDQIFVLVSSLLSIVPVAGGVVRRMVV